MCGDAEHPESLCALPGTDACVDADIDGEQGSGVICRTSEQRHSCN